MKLENIINLPCVETDRFELRPLRISDAGLIEMYTSDQRVAKMTRSIPHPLHADMTQSYIARVTKEDREEDVWAIDGTKSGLAEVMGLVTLERLTKNQSEMSYWVAPAFWNKGIASEAVTALAKENPLENDTIFAAVFQDNPASAKVLTNCGFEYIGDAEAFCVARNALVETWTYLKSYS